MMTPANAYLSQVQASLQAVDTVKVEMVVDALFDAFLRNATIFTIGNGASAALASHLACDLGKGTATDLATGPDTIARRRMRVISLTDNNALMTAYGNDIDYDDVFLEQLKGILDHGDVVLAISGSGGSGNILRALEYSRRAGATNLGLTGMQQSAERMLALCSVCVQSPSAMMEQIEDIHVIIGHIIAVELRQRMANMDALQHLARLDAPASQPAAD